ncbi:alpha/beta hydrolase family protein [Plantactinospora sp. DSM 117369]
MRLLLDPRELALDDGDLPAAERRRRERARESGGGGIEYACDAGQSIVAVTLGGELVVLAPATGATRILPSVGGVLDSLLRYAPELRRPLLLIHGLLHDDVHPAHMQRFSAKILAAGRPHNVLPLPSGTHMISAKVAARLLEAEVDFLRTALGADATAADGSSRPGGLPREPVSEGRRAGTVAGRASGGATSSVRRGTPRSGRGCAGC